MAGITSQAPSIFMVVARRTLERPPRALLDREFVEAMNHALDEKKSPAELRREPAREARHADAPGAQAAKPAADPAAKAKPRIDVHA